MSIGTISPHEVRTIRIAEAIGRRVNKNILIVVGGGLGDICCAEPTLRYCLEHFKNVSISLRCDVPELFAHLKFKAVYKTTEEVPKDQFLVWHTYAQGQLANEFFNPNLMNSVDFASISAIRAQLPLRYRSLHISCNPIERPELIEQIYFNNSVLVHLGKSWPSRTFPADWWNDLTHKIRKTGKVPLLIGKNCIEGIESFGCRDLRDKLSLNDYVWICQNARRIITNDSSPLHIAASGDGMIAFVPTCRAPDHLYHYRAGYTAMGGMKDFYKAKMWELFADCPNVLESNQVSEVPAGYTIDDFLPDTEEIVRWVNET